MDLEHPHPEPQPSNIDPERAPPRTLSNKPSITRLPTSPPSPTSPPWGPSHPCYPHPNPHVPLSSPLHPLTRIIRIPRSWLSTGDISPQFSSTYPETLTPYIADTAFYTLVAAINQKLRDAYDPFAWQNWLNSLLGVMTAWLWEDFKLGVDAKRGRRGVSRVEK